MPKPLIIPYAIVLAACGSSASDRPDDSAPVAPDAATPDATTADAGPTQPFASCGGLPATCGASGNGDCCESPVVPGGTFFRSYDVAGDLHSGTMLHPATISRFRLDKYEVTVGRFRAFVAAGPGTRAAPPATGAGAHPNIAGTGWDASWNQFLPADRAGLVASLSCDPDLATWTNQPGPLEDRPINCVSWYLAAAFCAWDGGFMPTEAEWNFAAAGGAEQRAYPWSSPPGSLLLDAEHSAYYDGADCVGDGTPDCTLSDLQVVGAKPAGDGRWGHSDLVGSLFQWTIDWAAAYPDPCTDCITMTSRAHKETRGGTFASNDDDLRSGHRLGAFVAVQRNPLVGMRCARSP